MSVPVKWPSWKWFDKHRFTDMEDTKGYPGDIYKPFGILLQDINNVSPKEI
jgi:hypothetical protein